LENHELSRLFNLYLERKASPEEVALLLEHFQVKGDEGLLQDLILQQLGKQESDENIIDIKDREMFKRVESGLKSRIDEEQAAGYKRRGYISGLRIVAAVAATLLLVTGIALWYISRPVQMITVYAAYGKVLQLRLPDSSRLWLSAGSTIAYPEKFSTKTRSVKVVNGDIFFAVAHEANRAFVIETKGNKISVLGTSFEVDAFDKRQTTNVTVLTGKVGIVPKGSNDASFLLPGERALINNVSHALQKVKVDTSDIASWRTGQLIFENQPLAEVMQILERTYNVRIEITNSRLLGERITMRLKNQPLADVMSAISFSNHLKFKMINDQLIVVN
jgi:ferric-dicitrate binding protein FerR (iron transport regulator)